MLNVSNLLRRASAAARIRSAADGDRGYAVVDAMVAMLTVSLAVVLILQALQVAHGAAVQAQEWRRIDTVAKTVLLDGPRTFQPASGIDEGVAWNLRTETTGAERPIALCRRVVEVRNTRSARQFSLATLEACPPVEGP